MTIKISASGELFGATSQTEVLRALAQQAQRPTTAAIAALTDNSGGTVSGQRAVLPFDAFTNEANAGGNLATKASTETALNLVKDALLELATKANAMATALGLPTITYNGGGTAADDTIAAIGASSAGATGVQAADMTTTCGALDQALGNIVHVAKEVGAAVGAGSINSRINTTVVATVAAITVDGGTAASPGVTKVAVDAALSRYADNIAVVASSLNDAATADTSMVLATI